LSGLPLPLAGRVAFVTGGSRSIGEAIALTLAGRGADVIVTDSGGGAAERVAEAIRALGRRPRPLLRRRRFGRHPGGGRRSLAEFESVISWSTMPASRDNLLMRLKGDDWDRVWPST
jgi:3-oxoacyl-[acyl-carrier protein] reductase